MPTRLETIEAIIRDLMNIEECPEFRDRPLEEKAQILAPLYQASALERQAKALEAIQQYLLDLNVTALEVQTTPWQPSSTPPNPSERCRECKGTGITNQVDEPRQYCTCAMGQDLRRVEESKNREALRQVSEEDRRAIRSLQQSAPGTWAATSMAYEVFHRYHRGRPPFGDLELVAFLNQVAAVE